MIEVSALGIFGVTEGEAASWITTVPAGLCQCGCGKRTRPARQNDAKRGDVRGVPVRYAAGHHARPTAYSFVVNRATGCWEWAWSLNSKGYARIVREKRTRVGHRAIYEALRGAVAGGLVLDHRCRNPRCVNPDHLEVVTQRENVRRGNAAFAQRGTKSRLAKLTEEIVATARTRHAGGETYCHLAREYGVAHRTMRFAVLGKTWRHVKGAAA